MQTITSPDGAEMPPTTPSQMVVSDSTIVAANYQGATGDSARTLCEHDPTASEILTKSALEQILNARLDGAKLCMIVGNFRPSCIDGRTAHEVAGVPGGDLGILMAGLAAYESWGGGTQLDDSTIRRIVSEHPATFYIHTDNHMEDELKQTIQKDARLSHLLIAHDAAWLIGHGTGAADTDDILLDLMTEQQGCGHMNKMRQHAALYRTRRELVTSVMKAVFRRMWEHPESVTREVLEGKHDEVAAVTFETEEKIEDMDEGTRIPVLRPSGDDGIKIFVYHPQVGKYLLHKELIPLLQGLSESGRPFDVDAFLLQAHGMLDHQVETTVAILGEGKPMYHVQFKNGTEEELHNYTISGGGIIENKFVV